MILTHIIDIETMQVPSIIKYYKLINISFAPES
jgi:hypothetical protein